MSRQSWLAILPFCSRGIPLLVCVRKVLLQHQHCSSCEHILPLSKLHAASGAFVISSRFQLFSHNVTRLTFSLCLYVKEALLLFLDNKDPVIGKL